MHTDREAGTSADNDEEDDCFDNSNICSEYDDAQDQSGPGCKCR